MTVAKKKIVCILVYKQRRFDSLGVSERLSS